MAFPFLAHFLYEEAVAKRFPELASRLPPPRKFYKPQDLRVSAFYAVALGLIRSQRNKRGQKNQDVFGTSGKQIFL